jgi:hypothetical protein
MRLRTPVEAVTLYYGPLKALLRPFKKAYPTDSKALLSLRAGSVQALSDSVKALRLY